MPIRRTATSLPYIVAIGLGSFLVFLIQPLAARTLLPAFGGSGAVWITALVFYQVTLAIGNLLAHVLGARLSLRGQTAALLALAAGAVVTLTVRPAPLDVFLDNPALRLMLSLAVSVGPPFLVLAVAGPLVQKWAALSRATQRGGHEVYSLYAVSNAASLIALAGYPTLVERLWSLTQQSALWDGLFIVEVALLALIAHNTRRVDWTPGSQDAERTAGVGPGIAASCLQALLWLSWSAAGVMVLTSTSAMIGQEIAAIPMLWIIPLLLYLVTWIVTFAGVVRPGREMSGAMLLAAVVLMIVAVDIRLQVGLPVRLGCALTGMTLACLAINASIYRLRPEERKLTRFYAALTSGGALGGILAGVVAVELFNDWRDLGLAFAWTAALCMGAILLRPRRDRPQRRRPAVALLAAGLVAAACLQLFGVTCLDREGLLYKSRDFHGVLRVLEVEPDHPYRRRLVMSSGTTVHGAQLLNPELRDLPTLYFGPGSGIEIAIKAKRSLAGADHPLDIGVVGLGVGTLAAYSRPSDSMRFYELSSVVAEVAQGGDLTGDPGVQFNFLDDAAGKVDVVVGDARTSLDDELAANPRGHAYDLFVLDAFAGDAVPTHLLTREAFDLYTAHLSATGMIAVHVSSNWVDLIPVVYAWAEAERWETLTISSRGAADGVSSSNAVWMLLFRGRETLAALAGQCQPLLAAGRMIVQNRRNVEYGDLEPWTDEHCDLVALMRTRIRLREDRVDLTDRGLDRSPSRRPGRWADPAQPPVAPGPTLAG